MEKHEWIEQELISYEARTGIKLDAHNRSTFRAMKRREYDQDERYGQRSLFDYIPGFDDGEPQTSVDFNRSGELE